MDFIGTLGDLLLRIENVTGIAMTDESIASLKDYYGIDVDGNLYTEVADD